MTGRQDKITNEESQNGNVHAITVCFSRIRGEVTNAFRLRWPFVD